MNIQAKGAAPRSHDGNPATAAASPFRHDWRTGEIRALYEMPFNDLLFDAHKVHREHFDANEVQLSTLLNIKTGGCAEDCKYCSQSSRYDTGLGAEKLMAKEEILERARAAKAAGAGRFCMGAAWRNLKDRDVGRMCDIISSVKDLGLETCVTLGMVTPPQASALREAGLDYYNHNIDTSEEFYGEVITTRTFQDRLDTLSAVREAGINVCCGGILGLGEGVEDRFSMLATLANLPEHPGSVPINMLVPIDGTPYAGNDPVDPLDVVRIIAVARILMPASVLRLSAGRSAMSEEAQALAFFAGANSIFYGEQLLTTPNPECGADRRLMDKLGIRPTGS